MEFKGLRLPPSSSRAQLEKVVLARKVGLFLLEKHDPGERQVVEDVARTLAHDLSVEVRQTLAFELRRAGYLPLDLAEKIARDVDDVSSPFLQHVSVFKDDDLARLARELDEHAQIAIARRSHVPDIVAVAIAETGGERPVTYLIRNPGAEIERACGPILNRFSGNRAMMDHLSRRGDLPLEIVQRLVDHVSQACRDALVVHYDLSAEKADALAAASRADTVLKWLEGASRGALNEHIRQLEQRGALTDRYLVDITKRGGLRFFESVMAYKTGIDIITIERIISAHSATHVLKLIRRAGYRDEQATRLLGAWEMGVNQSVGG
jgi:uncharacterized protein (DUF2336 family)